MAKADTNNTTNHVDASVFKKIAQVSELWRQTPELDEAQRTARRLGNLTEKKELEVRYDQIVDEACALEWEIAYTETATPDGHAAKCKSVADSNFDPEDLIEIAWALGYEAARLGLEKAMPQLTPPEPARAEAA